MPTPRTKQPEQVVALAAMLDRDLATLRREVEAYPDERDLWREIPGVPNVGGTLVLHLTGNLQHYLGTRLDAKSFQVEPGHRGVLKQPGFRQQGGGFVVWVSEERHPLLWARPSWPPTFPRRLAAPGSRPATISCISRSTLRIISGSSTIIGGS